MAQTRVIRSIACPRKDGVVSAEAMKQLAAQYTPYFKKDQNSRPNVRGQHKYVSHGHCGDALAIAPSEGTSGGGKPGQGFGRCIGSSMWVAAYLTELVFRPRPWLLAMFEDERARFVCLVCCCCWRVCWYWE